MTAIDRPLGLGELLAETVRLYGERIRAVAAIGLFLAGTLVVADLTGHVVGFVAVVSLAFTAAYAATARVVAGDRFVEACAQVGLRVPILLVLTVVVALPFVLGRIDPVLVIFSVAWLAFVGFSIPVAMLEHDAEARNWFERVGFALSRSFSLARVELLHAIGIAAALFLVDVVLGIVLASALVGFADNGREIAVAIAQVILAPLFFLGLCVLYFEQKVRALSSRPANPQSS